MIMPASPGILRPCIGGGSASSLHSSRLRRFKVQRSPTPSTHHPASTLVGRESERAQLHAWLEKARTGERQISFVTGEPGVGKTTLVETFLRGIGNWELGVSSLPSQSLNPQSQLPTPVLWIGRGQCIEHYGAGADRRIE